MEVTMSMVCLDDKALEQVVGGLTVQAMVAMNSPNGSKIVTAPPAANAGVLNAFTNVVTKGPGDLSNIDIILS
jgi:hypothetical protein